MTNGEKLGFVAFVMFWLMAVAGMILAHNDVKAVADIVFYSAWTTTVVWGAVSGKNIKEVFLKKYDKPQSLNPDPKGDE